MARRARLDAELTRRHLAPSRTAAQRLIEAGDVIVDGIAVPKAASQVTPDQPITIVTSTRPYASRGGLKLAGALDDLGVDPHDRTALDAGAAHGGFTDVLLRRGARQVIAVDVAYGQFAWSLRNDERVILHERTNIRTMTADDLDAPLPDLVVADLSFISLTKVLPALAALSTRRVTMLPLVKPQFEVGRDLIGKNGVVRDPDAWALAITGVMDAAQTLDLEAVDVTPSKAPGPAGNIEFFVRLERHGPTPTSPREGTETLIQRGIQRVESIR